MTINAPTQKGKNTATSLSLLPKQRSHVLVVLSTPQAGAEAAFLAWYQGEYRREVRSMARVLGGEHYEQHEVDISQGRLPRLPFRYLGLYELSLDGAEEAEETIERITKVHLSQPSAKPPATWLYYPACEKVGRSAAVKPSLLTLALASGLPGQEDAFREWYATRHIRHAMNVPALVSGQCLERTQFQRPGALAARFATIAVYEQEGTPEAMLESFAELIPTGVFRFPMMDRSCFAEWVYRPVREIQK